MTELVQLAEELVSLTGRIDAIKDLMRKILANGSDLHPPDSHPARPTRAARAGVKKSPQASEAKRRSVAVAKECDTNRDGAKLHRSPPAATTREQTMLAAAKAEEAIVELLRATPGMRTSAIAKAAGAPATTAQNRLLRLQRAGRIERGEDDGWRAASLSN